ncbi:MAG: NADH-quinone oxidoreductase subunit, partial [Solirubrobacterales bacterium]|nr:NADH-quinone oxidoreductase subunit [Solirubrobacterales bacterium]
FTVRDEKVKRVVTRDNAEVDDGWICDRGRYGFEMFDAPERITAPRLKGGAETDWETAIAAAAEGLRAAADIDHTQGGSNSAAPSKVAAIVGDASNEEGFLLQRLVREALGSPHVDSRPSRGPTAGVLRRLAEPNVSAKVRDIDEADAILVLGTDPLHSSPILDLRVRKAIRRNGAKLVVATERPTALDGGAEAIARYAPGQAAHFVGELAGAIGGSENVATPISATLRDAGRVVVLWGERIGREGDGAIAALLDLAGALDLAGSEGSGLLEIPDATNARGLREAGCLPDAGPGLSEVATGMSTDEIRAALESGELTSLILFGADPLRDFPDTPAWEQALTAADFVVSFSMFENATTAKAEVVFPLETHAEKDGTVTHPDGRLQRVRPSASRPGIVQNNLIVLAELAEALGLETGITGQPSAFAALTSAVPFYSGINDADIGGRGIRWQETQSAANLPSPEPDVGGPSERFAEEEGSAPEAPAAKPPIDEVPSEEGPPAAGLTLGTYRDLWAGPITELNPPLKFLRPKQRLEISPADAERLALKHGEKVLVGQNGAGVEAEVQIRERVAEGVVFLVEGLAEDNANGLLNGGPVRVEIQKITEVRA